MENITQGQWFRGPSADLGDEIAHSLKFNSDGHLTLAQKSTGDGLVANNRTFTFSTWFKHGDMGETNIFGIHSTSQENWLLTWTNFSNPGFAGRDSGGWGQYSSSPTSFIDPSAWYHLFLTCSSGVLSLRVNNVLQDQTDTQNHSMDKTFCIGCEHTNGGSAMDAWLAETYFFQGSVLDPVNNHFIRQTSDGIWVPDTPTNTNGSAFTASDYGTNGWHLTYDPAGKAGQTGHGAGIGADHSPNNNHFVASLFDTAAISASNESNDVDIEDTPTKLYPTYNKIALHSSQTTSEANLRVTTPSYLYAPATIGIPADCGKKFYWEVTVRDNTGNETLGMCDPSTRPGQAPAHGWVFCPPLEDIESDQGNISNLVDTSVSTINTGNGTTYMFAYDADTQNVWIGDSGTWYKRDGAAGVGNPGAGTNPFLTTSDNCIVDGATYAPATAGSSGGTTSYEMNFGQMDFVHSIPSGFVELHSANLPEPTIKNGKDHFQCVDWDGNGANTRTIATEFDPDLIWTKSKSHGTSHFLFDSVRGFGANKEILADSNNEEGNTGSPATDANGFVSGNSSGIQLTNGSSGIAYTNQGNRTYVAWCWKAGTSFTPTVTNYTNPSGSINKKAGFGIYKMTGTNQSNSSFTHGLDSRPEMVFAKNLDNQNDWAVFGPSTSSIALAPTATLQRLNEESPVNKGSNILTAINDTSLTFDSFGETAAAADYVFYCWHSVENYSKIGRYTGNGSADGPFIYCGFKPAFLLYHRLDQGGPWMIVDSTRSPQNPHDTDLYANVATIPGASTNAHVDLLSNGFRIRTNSVDRNSSTSAQYMYMAFAEHPFVGKNVPPATAR